MSFLLFRAATHAIDGAVSLAAQDRRALLLKMNLQPIRLFRSENRHSRDGRFLRSDACGPAALPARSMIRIIRIRAQQELKHALIISKQIDYLGKMPTVTPKPVRTSEKAKEMLRFDLDNAGEMAGTATQQVKTFAEAMAKRNPLGTIAGAVVVGVLIGLFARGRTA
jgi:hypothetical protein